MEKNIIVRFFWQHDPDLIILFHDPRFQGRQEKCSKHNPHPQSNPRNAFIKKILLAYLYGEDVKIPPPLLPTKAITITNYAVHFSIDLENEKDQKINAFLNSIRDGYRNSVIKNIIRYYYTRNNGVMIDYLNNPLYIMKSKTRKKEKSGTVLPPKPMQSPVNQNQTLNSKQIKKKSSDSIQQKPKVIEPEQKQEVKAPEPTEEFDFFGAIDNLI